MQITLLAIQLNFELTFAFVRQNSIDSTCDDVSNVQLVPQFLLAVWVENLLFDD